MTTGKGAVLCINLAAATHRWQHMTSPGVTQHLPPELQPMVRIEAVRGAALDPMDPELRITPSCRLRLTQRWRVCNGLQIDSHGALGCTLSHVRCWEWLRAHPAYDFALVLEDDCCPTASLIARWHAAILPNLVGAVDLIVLGYNPGSAPMPVRRGPGDLWPAAAARLSPHAADGTDGVPGGQRVGRTTAKRCVRSHSSAPTATS